MKRIVNDTSLESVATAIRTKGGTSGNIVFPDGFVTAIQNINADIDISDTTATASDVMSGEVFYTANRTRTTGTFAVQSKTGITPLESSVTVTPDTGYNAMDSVQVNAISSMYVGTGITRRDSTDMSVSGATVTSPAGYYSSSASKSVASGTVTAPSTITGTNATVSTGTNSITLTKTISVTPSVTASGYISSGTAGNSSVALTASVTTKSAATYYPSSSDQTISSSQYLTGTQTIKSVTHSNITAENIKKDVVVKIGDSADDDRILSVTGTLEGAELGTLTVTPTNSQQIFTGGSQLINTFHVYDQSNNYQSNVDLSGFNVGDTCTVTGHVYKVDSGATRDLVDISGSFIWTSPSNTYTVGVWTLTLTSSTAKITYTGTYSGEIYASYDNPDGFGNIGFHRSSAYDGWDEVVVNAIPAPYYDTSSVTASASDVVSGKTIVGSTGTTINGSLVIQHYYTGYGTPSSSLGVNGDIYLEMS